MADLKMPEINSVIIAGNLTRDPVFRTTQNGNPLVHFTVASNKRYRDINNQWKEDVCFVGVIARNRLAESCNQHLKKGSGVLIEGEIQSRDWKTEDGNARRVVEIKARRIQFLNRTAVKTDDEETDTVSEEENVEPENIEETTDPNVPDDVESSKPTKEEENKKDKPLSFEDDSYNKFISSEESELFKGDSPNKKEN